MRQLITDRRVTYGGWCMIPSPLVAEIVSASGCDWLCIDQQHGLIDDAAMLTPPPGHALVVTADAIVGGVHFFPAQCRAGSASNPLVPAGFRMWVKGFPVLGHSVPSASRYIGALIWTPERRSG